MTLRIMAAQTTKQFRIPCKTAKIDFPANDIFKEILFTTETEISGDT